MGKKVVLTKDEVNCPVCGITNTSLCARNPNYKGEWDEDECLVDFYFCKKCGYIEYKSKPEDLLVARVGTFALGSDNINFKFGVFIY